MSRGYEDDKPEWRYISQENNGMHSESPPHRRANWMTIMTCSNTK